MLNTKQQEFVQTIINYVRENGVIDREDLADNEPFSNYQLLELFGAYQAQVVNIVGVLHNSIAVGAAQAG